MTSGDRKLMLLDTSKKKDEINWGRSRLAATPVARAWRRLERQQAHRFSTQNFTSRPQAQKWTRKSTRAENLKSSFSRIKKKEETSSLFFWENKVKWISRDLWLNRRGSYLLQKKRITVCFMKKEIFEDSSEDCAKNYVILVIIGNSQW